MAYSQKAVNKHHKEKYWNMSITVPKDYKEDIQAAAAARGVSVSRMVCDLLWRELGLDLALDGSLPGVKKPDQSPQSGE